jgi:Uma2 family endonuclease
MSTEEPLAPLPPSGDENSLYEFLDGRFVVKAPIGVYGGMLTFELACRIEAVAEGRSGMAISHMLFQISRLPDIRRRPEAAFVSYERWPAGRRLPRADHWDMVPDLVVEVVGPTTRGIEILVKIRQYFEAGVRRAWVLYPDECLIHEYDSPRSIRLLGREDALEGGGVIPGFRLLISDLFDRFGERAK